MEVDADSLPQDTGSAQSARQETSSNNKFRPYASNRHRVTKGRYITSNDPRGYIPVYEYPLNGQWIMMDIDDGYILWTGIWKALGNAKADIVKMLESQPDLTTQLRRVRGGYLKIQGTWMPYEVALRLARRVAWPIREDLIPLFGPTFPSTCLSPGQPGYGQIGGTPANRRRPRRTFLSPLESTISSQILSDPSTGHTLQPSQKIGSDLPPISGILGATYSPSEARQKRPVPSPFAKGYSGDVIVPSRVYQTNSHMFRPSGTIESHSDAPDHHMGVHPPHLPYHQEIQDVDNYQTQTDTFKSSTSTSASGSSSVARMRSASQLRYEPYGSVNREKSASTSSSPRFPPLDRMSTSTTPRLSSITISDFPRPFSHAPSGSHGAIHLPPLRTIDSSSSYSKYYSSASQSRPSPISLPPISSLDIQSQSASIWDSSAVLRRLTIEDDTALRRDHGEENFEYYDDLEDKGPTIPTAEQLWNRRRSLSAPPRNQFSDGEASYSLHPPVPIPASISSDHRYSGHRAPNDPHQD